MEFKLPINPKTGFLAIFISLAFILTSLIIWAVLKKSDIKISDKNSLIAESSELYNAENQSENNISTQTNISQNSSILSNNESNTNNINKSDSVSRSTPQTVISNDPAWMPSNNVSKTAIQIDFAIKDFSQTPYLKKIDMFSSTWSWLNPAVSNTALDKPSIDTIPSIAKLRPESMRTDLFMGYGGVGGKIGSTTILNGTTAAEFNLVKQLTTVWKANRIRGNFCYFANPIYSGGGSSGNLWKTTPDKTKWNELCYNIAKYFKDNDFGVMTHEILNEPEYFKTSPQVDGFFFSGSWQDYINTYIAGATGIRAADKDAIIGGISAAWIQKLQADGRYANFLNQIKNAGAPLDYVSWHYYGYYGKFEGNTTADADLNTYITAARKGLNESNDLSTVQQHLNEFNVTCQGVAYQTYGMTEAVLNVFQRLLSATDITRVSWAAPLEYDTVTPALCLIDPKTFERYPAFRTMWMYARLPVERVKTSNVTEGVKMLASRDEGRAALILYDIADKEQKIELALNGINMNKYNVTVYSLDKKNPVSDPKSDEPKILYQYNNQTGNNIKYNVVVPKEGAIYIEINDTANGTSLDFISKYSTKVVRKDYWYPQRGDNFAFADVNLNSMSACVGAGSSKEGLGANCSITLKDMSNESFNVKYDIVGAPTKKSSTSMLGVKIDYEVNGQYTKSVYFYLNNIDGSTIIPLGTKSVPNQIVSMGNNSGSFSLSLNNYAPTGWDGRIQLSYLVNNIGINNGAVFYIR